MSRIGIYAGSFDPPTLGHLWMIQQGALLFDELVVVLAVNPEKKSFLCTEERRAALQEMISDIAEAGRVRVEVMERGFLVDFAEKIGATHLLRGVRDAKDFDYERTMACMNARMAPGIHTVFMIPPGELEAISSTLVRGFVGEPGSERWLKACVPEAVYTRIESQQKQ